jgi:hypothetical protein
VVKLNGNETAEITKNWRYPSPDGQLRARNLEVQKRPDVQLRNTEKKPPVLN